MTYVPAAILLRLSMRVTQQWLRLLICCMMYLLQDQVEFNTLSVFKGVDIADFRGPFAHLTQRLNLNELKFIFFQVARENYQLRLRIYFLEVISI